MLAAAEPSGYYSSAAGKTGNALKSALHQIIDNHYALTYAQVWDALMDLDEDPNNSSNVLLIYSRVSRDKNRHGGASGDWNREHSWPKSHGFPTESNLAYTDVHHLRASDVTVNSIRSNKDYDIGGSVVSGASLCRSDSDSFEPPDEVKGDLARGIFYMAVRYEGGSGESDLEIAEDPGSTSSGTPQIARLSTLLAWHTADPVSDEERLRNDKIYYHYQSNRNPFIDHPEWVQSIWLGGNTSGWNSECTHESSPNYPSDYPNDYNHTISFTKSGASKMRLHFAAFRIESGYDNVDILDGNDRTVATYTGNKGAFTSVEVSDNTIKLRFVSDYSVTDTGWLIDALEWTSGDTAIPPSSRITIFQDEFASTAFNPRWTTGGTGNWRVRLTSSYGPRGNYHAVLDASSNGSYSASKLTYNQDLSAYRDIQVEFYYKEYSDENHSYDGLYIYNGSWIRVLSFNNGPSSYTKYTVDLSGYSHISKIEWQQYDDYGLTSDGVCIDDIQITGVPR